MGKTGIVAAPHSRWGGKWKPALEKMEVTEEWAPVVEYGRTSSYQVARALNIGRDLPQAPEGKAFEFAARENADGTSTLLVRFVDDDERA